MSEKGFSIKGQMVNILDFVGRMVSVVTLSLLFVTQSIIIVQKLVVDST